VSRSPHRTRREAIVYFRDAQHLLFTDRIGHLARVLARFLGATTPVIWIVIGRRHGPNPYELYDETLTVKSGATAATDRAVRNDPPPLASGQD
jgi:hypothetical protein